MRLRRVMYSLALALCMIASTTALTTDAASAATAVPPDFKLPLKCGTTWMADTYNGHGNALDFNAGANGATQDRGEPVLAAAAGRVLPGNAAKGEVLIDHGGGWVTRYLHMYEIQVSSGRFVSEGQWIGRIGDVGAAAGAYHLHFEVKRDGQMVPPVIDGQQSSVPTTRGRQVYTSTNCLSGIHGLWFANQLIRAPDGTIDYVTASGERYWVPNGTVLSCLQSAGARVMQVDWNAFNANPRNEYGDPGGRWADCNTWTVGWMVRGSGPAVWFVAPNGLRYHVPNEAVVMCLGGWAAVRGISDGALGQVPANPWGATATCQSPLIGEMIRNSAGTVSYVGPKGTKYWVPSGAVVDCLGGWPQVVQVRDARFNAIPGNRYGAQANCNAPLLDRMVRKANGQVDYVTGNGIRYWVPNGSVVGCLGGWGSVIFLSDGRFNGIPRNGSNAWATCSTKNL
jgi:hypothetical protein